MDPVELYDLNGVKQILNREEIKFPEQEDDENEVDYRRRLIEVSSLSLGFSPSDAHIILCSPPSVANS